MQIMIPLTHPRHKPPQALAAVKNKVRKYMKRERRKTLPAGADYWDFDCKVGPSKSKAVVVHPSQVVKQIDSLAKEGLTEVYVEILVKPVTRTRAVKNTEPDL